MSHSKPSIYLGACLSALIACAFPATAAHVISINDAMAAVALAV